MERKPITTQRQDGTIYYAWTAEELAGQLKLLCSLNVDARRYYNHYLKAKEKGNQHETQYNWAMLMNVKEMIQNIKDELMKDH